MDDIVARYTLKFSDLASKGMLRAASVARGLGTATNVATVGIAALAVGAAAAGKAAFNASNKWATFYDDLGEAAARTNVSAGFLRDMSMAMNAMGVEQSQTEAGFTKFNVTLGKIRSSGLPGSLAAMSDGLGFLSDASVSTESAISRVFKIMDDMPDAAQAAALGAALFGKGAGAAMAAAARDGETLEKRIARVRAIGGPVTAKTLQDASDYKDAMGDAQMSLSALQMRLGAAAAPTFMLLTEKFLKYITENAPAIEASMAGAFEKIGAAVADVDWALVAHRLLKLSVTCPRSHRQWVL